MHKRMVKITVFLICGLATVLILPTTEAGYAGALSAPPFICGDANEDESVDMLDIIYLINYLYKGGPPPYPLAAADANGDGNVDMLDIIYLINYLYKGGPPPVCL